MTIIQIDVLPTGQHPVESQSDRESCWLEGYIEVPAHLEAAVWDTLGWCDLTIVDGVLTAVTPKERPQKPDQEAEQGPTQEDRISALESAMLAMMEV